MKSNNYVKKLLNHPILLLLFSFAVPAAAMLWSYVSDIIGNKSMVYVALLLLLLTAIMLLMVQAIFSSSIKQEFYNKVETLEGFIEATGAGRISSITEMMALESVASDITIITPDLKDDITQADIIAAVSDNLGHNKPYHYILQDTTASHGYLDAFARIHGKDKDIKVTFIPENNFIFTNDIIIYNLLNTDKQAQSFFAFPSADFDLFVRLDDVNQQQVLGVVRKISNSYKSQPITNFS
jgi:hypothetical protein